MARAPVPHERIDAASPARPGFVVRSGDAVRNICDRFWLFTIAAISLVIVGAIALAVVIWGMPEDAGELFGAMVTGLLLIAQKVIDAQQQRRMADQLATSRPGSADDGEAMNVEADEVTVQPTRRRR